MRYAKKGRQFVEWDLVIGTLLLATLGTCSDMKCKGVVCGRTYFSHISASMPNRTT